MILASVLLIFLTIIWGSTFPIIQMSLTDIQPFTLMFLRFAVAAVFILPVSFLTKNWKLKEKKSALVCGALLFGGFTFQTFGLQYTTSTRAAFITGLCVVLVPIFETLFFKRKQPWRIWLGVFISFLGLAILTISQSRATSNETQLSFNNTLLGDMLVLGCATLFGLHILFMSKYSKTENALALASWQIVFVVPIGLVFFSLQTPKVFQWPSLFSLLAISYLAVFATALATVVQLWAQRKLSASQAAILISLEPVFASFFSNYWLKEKLSTLGIAGCTLMLCGCLFASFNSAQIGADSLQNS